MFVNSLPLKNHIDSSLSFRDFLNNVKTNFENALNHQMYPFDNLVSDLNLAKDRSRNSLFDTMFIYQSTGISDINLDGNIGKYFPCNTKTSKFDLSLEVIPCGAQEFGLNFEYSTKLFSQKTIERFSLNYVNLLENLILNLDITIQDIDIMSNEERKSILGGFEKNLREYNYSNNIFDEIKKNSANSLNSVAIETLDEKITYLELINRVNKLSNYLLKNGITSKSNIGVFTSRNIDTIVSILAIINIRFNICSN